MDLQEYFAVDSSRPFPNKEVAEKNRLAMLTDSPWMAPEPLGMLAEKIINENASVRVKRKHMLALTDRANEALMPHSACRAGCSHCCHIPVMIFSCEAEEIARHTRRTVSRVPKREPDALKILQSRFYGVACPFLKEGRCSVYEVRPFACRQQHSLDDTPAQCDLNIPAEESSVPSYAGMKYVELAYTWLLLEKEVMGDIREFFPDANS